jgi:hypothetical protein
MTPELLEALGLVALTLGAQFCAWLVMLEVVVEQEAARRERAVGEIARRRELLAALRAEPAHHGVSKPRNAAEVAAGAFTGHF